MVTVRILPRAPFDISCLLDHCYSCRYFLGNIGFFVSTKLIKLNRLKLSAGQKVDRIHVTLAYRVTVSAGGDLLRVTAIAGFAVPKKFFRGSFRWPGTRTATGFADKGIAPIDH